MKEKIEQIIDRNTEGNYLLSSADKAQMVSEILDLFGVMPSLPDGLDDDSNCDHNFKLGWIACWKALTGNEV